jgi:putative transposase
LREAFPYDSKMGCLVFDRGTNFNAEGIETMKSFGIKPKRTAFRSPWQNGVAERWVGNCRRDMLDHVMGLNERHLKRLMSEYVHDCHDNRIHLALEKRTPAGRVAAEDTNVNCKVVSMPRLRGLHHRYDLAARSTDIFKQREEEQRESCIRRPVAERSTSLLSPFAIIECLSPLRNSSLTCRRN